MTICDMHIAVYQELMKVGGFAHDNFLPEELDSYLNKAQGRFIKQRFNKLSNPKRQGFEDTAKRLEDLRELVRVGYTDAAQVEPLEQFNDFDLPQDILFMIPGSLRVDIDVCQTQRRVPCRIVESEWLHRMQQIPYAKSLPSSPLAQVYDDQIRVYGSPTFSVKKIIMDYLKKPVVINIFSHTDCELAEHTHQEIVDLAVNMMLEAMEAPRIQTHTQQLFTNE